MPTSPQVAVDITANDKTAKGILNAQNRLKKMADGVERAQSKSIRAAERLATRSGSTLIRTYRGVEAAASKAFSLNPAGLISRLSSLTEAGAAVGTGFGEAAVAGGILTQSLTVLGVGAVALTAIVGAAAYATYKLASSWAAGGAAIGRTATTLAMATKNLQAWQQAAARVGVDPNSAMGAIGAFAENVHGARYGYNPSARAALMMAHIGLRTDKSGNEDINSMLVEASGAVARQRNPMTQKHLADTLGLGALLPFLREGPARVRAELSDAGRHGTIYSEAAINKSTAFQHDSVATEQLIGRGKLAAGEHAADLARPVVDKLLISGDRFVDSAQTFADAVDAFVGNGFGSKAGKMASDIGRGNIIGVHRGGGPTRVEKWLGSAERWVGGALGIHPQSEVQARDYFMKQGWTAAQASGIVANLQAESGLRAHGPAGDSGLAQGLAQWHPDRQAQFKRLFGHDVQHGTYAEQLAFVQWELTHGRGGNRLRRARTAREAGAIVSQYYESPRDREREKRLRGHLAEQVASLPSHQEVVHNHKHYIVVNHKDGSVSITTETEGAKGRTYSRAMTSSDPL
jgi:hypothetical protein